MDNMIFLQNPWENKLLDLVNDVESELIIICPFIKEEIITKILACLKDKKLKILLKTNIFEMSKNVFDLECLYLLNSHNTEIRTIKNLHAKLFIFDNEKAIFTSSNLTKAGLNSNVEFGILVNDKNYVTDNLIPIIDDYWNSAKKIDKLEIENIKIDLNKISTFESHHYKNNIKISANKHVSTYVSPKGQDITTSNIHLTNRKKLEIIADRLMIGDINEDEIISICSKYFKDKKFKNILRSAFRYSFNSDNPIYTAGIYFKNASKVYSRFNIMLYESNVETFKNMIMEKGNTNIIIKTAEDYYMIENEYLNSFNVDPPNKIQVFEAVLNDEKCINKIANNIAFYFRIENIFSFIPEHINELKLTVLTKLYDLLGNSKEKMENRLVYNEEEKIQKSEAEIKAIEEKIKILTN